MPGNSAPDRRLAAERHVLWLLRHGKSSWSSDAVVDHERPLAGRGRRDARRIGAWMARHRVRPDAVWSSTALRARQTLERACEVWTVDPSRTRLADGLYHASAAQLLAILARVPDGTRCLMLVGHNPGLEDLLVLLCGTGLPRTAKGKLLTTGNLAEIAISCSWAALGPGCGELRRLLRPRELGADS